MTLLAGSPEALSSWTVSKVLHTETGAPRLKAGSLASGLWNTYEDVLRMCAHGSFSIGYREGATATPLAGDFVGKEYVVMRAVDVASAAFRRVPEVQDVRVVSASGKTMFFVFVNMPRYDRGVMLRLFDAERAVDRLLAIAGGHYEYRYPAWPITTPDDIPRLLAEDDM